MILVRVQYMNIWISVLSDAHYNEAYAGSTGGLETNQQ